MPDIRWTISADDGLTPVLEHQAEAYQRVNQAAQAGAGGAGGGNATSRRRSEADKAATLQHLTRVKDLTTRVNRGVTQLRQNFAALQSRATTPAQQAQARAIELQLQGYQTRAKSALTQLNRINVHAKTTRRALDQLNITQGRLATGAAALRLSLRKADQGITNDTQKEAERRSKRTAQQQAAQQRVQRQQVAQQQAAQQRQQRTQQQAVQRQQRIQQRLATPQGAAQAAAAQSIANGGTPQQAALAAAQAAFAASGSKGSAVTAARRVLAAGGLTPQQVHSGAQQIAGGFNGPPQQPPQGAAGASGSDESYLSRRLKSLAVGFVGYRVLTGVLQGFGQVQKAVDAAAVSADKFNQAQILIGQNARTSIGPLPTLYDSVTQNLHAAEFKIGAAFGQGVVSARTVAYQGLTNNLNAPGASAYAKGLGQGTPDWDTTGTNLKSFIIESLRNNGGQAGPQQIIDFVKRQAGVGTDQDRASLVAQQVNNVRVLNGSLTDQKTILDALATGGASYDTVLASIDKNTQNLTLSQQSNQMSLERESMALDRQIQLFDRARQSQQAQLQLAAQMGNITRMQRGAIDVYSSQGQSDIQALPGALQQLAIGTQNYAYMAQGFDFQDQQYNLAQRSLVASQGAQGAQTNWGLYAQRFSYDQALNMEQGAMRTDLYNYGTQLGLPGFGAAAPAQGGAAWNAPGMKGRASGGPLSDGWYTVGEKGPEPLHVGAGGGYILPHNSAGAAGGVVEHVVTHLCPACLDKWIEHPRTGARIARNLGGLRKQ